jgi:molybdenum cofactor biosynthesis protein B
MKKVHEKHKHAANKKKELNIALIIVSTSRYEEMQTKRRSSDKTIPLVRDILSSELKMNLKCIKIIPDSSEYVKLALDEFLNTKSIDAIIFSGGTGLSPKDITYETIEPRFEKILPGFGELFRYLSYQEIGSAAMLSRAIAGKINTKGVFLLPGSPNAVELALKQLIIPELFHMVYLINKKE